jgi:hypothetical protein
MTKEQVKKGILDAASLTRSTEFVIVGSQAVQADDRRHGNRSSGLRRLRAAPRHRRRGLPRAEDPVPDVGAHLRRLRRVALDRSRYANGTAYGFKMGSGITPLDG